MLLALGCEHDDNADDFGDFRLFHCNNRLICLHRPLGIIADSRFNQPKLVSDSNFQMASMTRAACADLLQAIASHASNGKWDPKQRVCTLAFAIRMLEQHGSLCPRETWSLFRDQLGGTEVNEAVLQTERLQRASDARIGATGTTT
jgi:hypothetical protein